MPASTAWHRFGPAVLVLLGCLLVGSGVGHLARTRDLAQREAEVRVQLQAARDRLAKVAETTFAATASLETLLRVHGGLDEASFRAAVEVLLREQSQLRNVVAAPGDVVAYVYPLAGNERVLGLDYRQVPVQWQQILAARQDGNPMIFAPVRLVQGGLGVVQRRPIFLANGNQGELSYWGTVSAVADLERFIQQAALPEGALRLALMAEGTKGAIPQLIWGEGALGAERHLRDEVSASGARWVLLGSPREGWWRPWWQSWWIWITAAASLLLVLMTFLLTQRRLALQNEVRAHRESRQETEQARERLQALLRTASDWYWEQDADLRLSFISASAELDSAGVPQAPLGKTRWEHPQRVHGLPDEAAWRAHREQQLRREPFRDFDYAVRSQDGSLRWLSVAGEPVFDAQGKFLGYRGTGRDITAYRAVRQRLQDVLDAAVQVGIIAIDTSQRVTLFNRGAERLLGHGASSVLGSRVDALHQRQELEARRLQMQAQLGHRPETPELVVAWAESGPPEQQHWTLMRRDGSELQVSLQLSALHDQDGRPTGHLGVLTDLSLQLQAQAETRSSAARLTSLMAAPVQAAIIAIDLEGRITLFNRGAELMVGWRAEEMLGQAPTCLHVPEELQARCAALAKELGEPVSPLRFFAQHAQRERPEPLHWTYQHRDGHLLTVSQTLACLRDAQGHINGYLGMMIDISAQRAAEERLRTANARLSAVLDASLEVGMLVIDPQGKVTVFNRGAERMLGYSAAEMLGQSALRLHDRQELRERHEALQRELGHECSVFELFARQAMQPPGFRTRNWLYVRKDGQRLQGSMSLAPICLESGEQLGFLAMGRDIGDQLAAEQAERQARDRLQAVLDGALEVAIVVCDNLGHITLFNRGAERLFGYPAHEVLGRPTLMLQDRQELEQRRGMLEQQLDRPLRLPEAMTLALRQGGSALSHWHFVRKGGDRFIGALRLSALRDPAGGPPSYLAVVLDISEQLSAREALEQLNRELEQRVEARGRDLAQVQEGLMRSERMAALGSLVAGVAHELNTPLGTAMTAASTLHDRSLELMQALKQQQLRRSTLEAYGRDTEQMAELLMRSLRNASDLVSHFKQLSVDQTGDQRRSFQLDTVVSDVLSVLRPQLKQGRLRVETDIELPQPIDAYPGELGRMLTNLILNAQLHAFAPDEEGRVLIRAHPLDDTHLLLQLSDNGCGMSDEVRRRAFDPFFTTRLGSGGSGLGLNIVFNIATGVLGGEVELISEPGKGSLFEFRLPYQAPQRHQPGADMLSGTTP